MHNDVDALEHLQAGERKFLQDLLDRFRNVWQQADNLAEAVDLRNFLPPKGPLRELALCELIQADLEMQWQRGRKISLDIYLEQFPELGSAQALPVALICEEYRVRHCYGDKPSLAAYQARFPKQFSEVERRVQAALSPAIAHATLKSSAISAGLDLAPEDQTTPTPRTNATAAPSPVSQASERVPDKCEVLPLGGGYKLVTRIGRGGFGDVWRAEAPGGVEVAIKIILGSVTREEAGQREFQALELMRRLRHAYLLPIHAYWQLEDRLIIAMELADGSLRDFVKKRAKEGKPGLPLDELTRYFREAAEAIDYLHANHVLHRDIKPENILLLGGHAQVADFGLARVLEQSRGLTATRGCGTPAYMAPEIIGQSKVGEQSDQYSLAASFAELRLNRPLFPATSFYDLMQDHLKKMPDLAPLDEAEQQVLLRALAKDPGRRYGSCMQFMQEVEKAQVPKAPERSRRSLRRRLLVTTLLLFPVLSLIGFLTWYLSPGRSFKLPHPWKKAAEAKLVFHDGRVYYDQIDVVPGGTPVRFILVPKDKMGRDAPDTFYMMRDKVWVGLFRQFANADKEKVKNSRWEDVPSNKKNERYPVMGVVADDAHQFAQWLGGDLPQCKQWDQAAGRYTKDRGEGPFRKPFDKNARPQVAVGREEPEEVGRARDAISLYGICDMAGNGYELTRDLALDDTRKVPLAEPDPSEFIRLRGCNYLAERPLRFVDLEDRKGDRAQPYLDSGQHTSFRVVVEP